MFSAGGGIATRESARKRRGGGKPGREERPEVAEPGSPGEAAGGAHAGLTPGSQEPARSCAPGRRPGRDRRDGWGNGERAEPAVPGESGRGRGPRVHGARTGEEGREGVRLPRGDAGPERGPCSPSRGARSCRYRRAPGPRSGQVVTRVSRRVKRKSRGRLFGGRRRVSPARRDVQPAP